MVNGFFRKIWLKWKPFAEKVGNFQAKVILSVLYFIVFVIPGVIVTVFSDFLDIKGEKNRSWSPREVKIETLEDVRRQW